MALQFEYKFLFSRQHWWFCKFWLEFPFYNTVFPVIVQDFIIESVADAIHICPLDNCWCATVTASSYWAGKNFYMMTCFHDVGIHNQRSCGCMSPCCLIFKWCDYTLYLDFHTVLFDNPSVWIRILCSVISSWEVYAMLSSVE